MHFLKKAHFLATALAASTGAMETLLRTLTAGPGRLMKKVEQTATAPRTVQETKKWYRTSRERMIWFGNI